MTWAAMVRRYLMTTGQALVLTGVFAACGGSFLSGYFFGYREGWRDGMNNLVATSDSLNTNKPGR